MPGKFSLCDSGGPQTIMLDNVWAQKNEPRLIEGDQETLALLIVRVLETLV